MKYINHILMAAALLGAVSCTDLDETVYNQVPMDGYGETESEISTIVGSAYASLRGYSDATAGYACYPASEFVLFLDETTSDEACIPTRGTDWYDNGTYIEAQQHNFTATNKLFGAAWRYCYTGITTVNSVIYQLDKAGKSPETNPAVYAELRSLRAYYYWKLLDYFGDVPIVTDFNQQGLPAKSSRNEVFSFVETELKQSLPHLSAAVKYGQITQNVAHMILARLYLNAETYVGQARWQDCITECEQISGYTLNPDYFKNFVTDNDQNAQEIIFAIPYDHKNGTLGNYMNAMSVNAAQWKAYSNTNIWSANGMCAQPGVYSSFEESDIRRNALLIGPQKDKNTGSIIVTDKGNQLNYTENVDQINMGGDAVGAECQGARLNKYELADGEEWERDHDFVVMRYAEVLLMQAECYLRMGYPSAGLPFVNQVRQRAGLGNLTELNLDNLDQEWMHEFLFEGMRRMVNIRFGKFFEPWWEKPDNSMDATRKTKFCPIPADILSLNPSLVQNPDYQ